MKPVTVIARKPRIGIDCRMSSSGTSTFSAARQRDAAVANAKLKSSEKTSASSMRSVVRNR